MCRFTGGLIYKSNGSNMQSATSISFLALAYAKYLSDVSTVARCGTVEATPARLRAFAKRQVGAASACFNMSGFFASTNQ